MLKPSKSLWFLCLCSYYVSSVDFTEVRQRSALYWSRPYIETHSIGPSLASLVGSPRPLWCNVDLYRCFFFKFSYLFGLITVFLELEFSELTILFPKIFITLTTAVIFPVLEFSVAFCLALVISRAVLVALIGQVSVDFKSVPGGLSNLKPLSTWLLGLLYPLFYSMSKSLSN